MEISPLQLKAYFITEFHFVLQPDYVLKRSVVPVTVSLEDMEVNVDEMQHNTDPYKWQFILKIELKDPDQKYPYKFLINLNGFFEVDKKWPLSKVESLAVVNGPSVLYSAARETLATLTGRSSNFSIFLPTISFASVVIPTEENKEGVATPDPSPSKPKRARKKKSD